jgi:general secretion pathway protein B
MSYILDALRKSEQQRQRTNAPTLLHAPVLPASPKPVRLVSSLALAVSLIGAGMLLGWLQPWKGDMHPVAVLPDAPRSQPLSPPPPLALPMPLKAAGQTAPSLPPNAGVPATRAPEAARPVIADGVADADHRERAAASKPQPAAPAGQVMRQSELPSEVQQALPGIMIAFHQYSVVPAERRVMINNSVLREGELIAPGVRLEQITPDGVVIDFQGYLFARGVH